MVPEIAALTTLIASKKGLYVPLLGSGVSRSAGIPTGHEVMLDLTRRAALAAGKTLSLSESQRWFLEIEGRSPTYSSVLGRLGHTPEERTTLLRGYFEPTEDERQEGTKLPTKGHRALADLAKRGFLRTFVTTNFDHLLEAALREEGLEPLVLYSKDQVVGMPPIAQIPLLVLKLHGDYLDLRTMNTEEELSGYAPEVEALLDRILDEHGMLVCGWSAQHDVALRAAFERCTSRRFSTFWTLRSEPRPEAKGLIAHREARVIPINDADTFLHELREGVVAVAEEDRVDVLTRRVAAARIKRYLPDEKRYIDLEELVAGEAARVEDQLKRFSFSEPAFTLENAAARVRHYESILDLMLLLLFLGGYWGLSRHLRLWIDTIQRVTGPNGPVGGNEGWIDLADYPALATFYACGVAAVAGGNLETVSGLLQGGKVTYAEREAPFVLRLHSSILGDPKWLAGFPELANKKVPVSERAVALLRPLAGEVRMAPERFEASFDEWELLLSMSHAHERQRIFGRRFSAPVGRFCYRHAVLDKFKTAIAEQGGAWPYSRIGLFGGDAARAMAILTAIEQQPEVQSY